jgi:hypothetical protein
MIILQNWMKNKNSIYLPNVCNFGLIRPPFLNKIPNFFVYDSSKTHWVDHLQKATLKLNGKKKQKLGEPLLVKNSNSYIINTNWNGFS